MKKIGIQILMIIAIGIIDIDIANAQELDNLDNVNDNELFDLSLEKLLELDASDKKFKIYGFFDSKVEKVFNVPSLDNNGNTIKSNDPLEWSPINNFHLYGSGNLEDNIEVFFNLASNGSDAVEIRNVFGNIKFNEKFQLRVGKMYRKFGLYNERLDQVPTFVGIEPPELFDNDHLLLPRFTNFMIHGEIPIKTNTLLYAVSTGNPEGGAQDSVHPLGWDLRFRSHGLGIIIGTSGYTSNIGDEKTNSATPLGNGPSDGGVLPWLEGSRYTITGFFIEKTLGKFFLQTEYWISNHNATRNPDDILTLINNANLNSSQIENFLGDNFNSTNPSEADVIRTTDFNVSTFYARLGYKIESGIGQFVPYVFFDTMSHPEIIQSKKFGGDNESGLADDGKFIKTSYGLLYRPQKTIAIKLDGSIHTQEFNGRRESYPEIRLDFAFSFDAL